MATWAAVHAVELSFAQPGMSAQNAYIFFSLHEVHEITTE